MRTEKLGRGGVGWGKMLGGGCLLQLVEEIQHLHLIFAQGKVDRRFPRLR